MSISIAGALVTYAILWFLTLFVLLQNGVRSQAEEGEIEPGTPPGAPSAIRIKRKFLWATILAFIPWALFFAVLESGLVSIEDFNFLFPESFSHTTLTPSE